MEYSIQSALWDRLLNAPANFFRLYPAGDLAERAAGIDAIQQLVSGAGVAAILGLLQRPVLRRADVPATTCTWRWWRSA